MVHNTVIAQTDKLFRKACELASVEPTKRQASKFCMGRGLAYSFRKQAAMDINLKKEGQ